MQSPLNTRPRQSPLPQWGRGGQYRDNLPAHHAAGDARAEDTRQEYFHSEEIPHCVAMPAQTTCCRRSRPPS